MQSPRTTLFRQFILRLAPPLLITVLLALLANVFVGYKMAYKEQQERQEILSNAYAQSLVKPLWDCDDEAALGIMKSQRQTESIDGSVLNTTCTGQTLHSGLTENNDEEHSRFNTNHTLAYYDESGRSFDVGTLTIFFKPVSIMHSAADSLWFYLTVTALMALCLISVTLFVFRNLISRPLNTFQRVIKQHSADTSIKAKLPTQGRNDELSDVLNAYDRLMGTISEQQDALALQARIDPLTGLGNRLYLQECFDQALSRAQQLNGTGYVLLFDLDGFKPINDTLGHAAGDFVLKAVAQRLQEAVRDNDVVIRLGGDEFVVIVAAQTQPAHVQDIVGRVRMKLGAALEYEGNAITVAASIGVAKFHAETCNSDAILLEADQAMYDDKALRKAAR